MQRCKVNRNDNRRPRGLFHTSKYLGSKGGKRNIHLSWINLDPRQGHDSWFSSQWTRRLPGGFDKKRDRETIFAEIRLYAGEPSWIMEGVFGDLASAALENATALIFLNFEWISCEAGLKMRGPEIEKQTDAVIAQKNFSELLGWAKAYEDRENSRSRGGHQKIFDQFGKSKILLKNRQDLDQFINDRFN